MDRQDTFNQKPVKRTHRFVVVLMLIACCCSPCNAQGRPSPNVYTIIGDVAAPNIYQWPLGEPVTLQMLLMQSKALGSAGKAIIRKANEPARAIPVSVWTNLENPIRLNPSDTVVWRSANGSNLNNGTVALLTDRGTQLQPIPISGVDIGTLRQSARLRFDQPVLAYRNGWHDQQAFQMNSSSSVLHGDVLDVRTRRAPQQNARSMRPQMGSQAVDRVVKTVSNLNQDRTSGLTVPQAPVYPQVAGSSSIKMPAPLPTDAHTLRIPNSTVSQADDSGFASNSSTDGAAAFTEVARSSFSESDAALDSAATIEQLADEALNPTVDAQQSGTQSFLSGVFLFGLVLAVGLITIGIVRTRQEQRLHDQVRVGDQKHAYARSDRQADIRTNTSTPKPETLDQTPADLSKLPAESITQFPAFSKETAAVDSCVDQLIDENEVSQKNNDSEVFASTLETLSPKPQTSQSTEPNLELENCPVLSAGLNEADSSDHHDRMAKTIPFADLATDKTTSSPTNQLANDSTESASLNLAAAEPVLDMAPWLEDDLDEEGEHQPIADVAIQDAAEEEVAVVQDIEAETDVVDQQSTKPLPENTIRLQLLKSATNSLAQDASSEDLILDLPDVDSIRSSLEFSESESSVAAAERSDCQASQQTCEDLQSIGEPNVEAVFMEKSANVNADQVDSPQTIQQQEDIMAQPPMTQAEAQYLEDLIQNRLPMELSETQLPLKISLFGKPEGPRRLRIDAAHTTIAAPHMASTASRAKRREPAMAAGQAATKQESKAANASAQSESMGQSEATGQLKTKTAESETESRTQQSGPTDSATTRHPHTASQNPTSGLDKALNFLEEQSKS